MSDDGAPYRLSAPPPDEPRATAAPWAIACLVTGAATALIAPVWAHVVRRLMTGDMEWLPQADLISVGAIATAMVPTVVTAIKSRFDIVRSNGSFVGTRWVLVGVGLASLSTVLSMGWAIVDRMAQS